MTNSLNDMRRYGVELEFTSSKTIYEMATLITIEVLEPMGMNCRVAPYTDKSNTWRLKPDCSIRGTNGMELVTPILQGERDMDTLKRVVAICEQYGEVNRSCGMHVHIDITDEGEKPLRRLMKFFAKYENAINGLLSMSRRGHTNHYCANSFNNDDLVQVFGSLNKLNKRKLLTSDYFSRRGKWNFQNYWRHGSIENRAHQGTLCCDKVENWVRLSQGFVKRAFDNKGVVARVGDTTETYDSKAMLDDLARKNCITKATKKFYIKRHKELN